MKLHTEIGAIEQVISAAIHSAEDKLTGLEAVVEAVIKHGDEKTIAAVLKLLITREGICAGGQVVH